MTQISEHAKAAASKYDSVRNLHTWHLEQCAQLAIDAATKELTEELESVKKGYHQLDRNWEAVHETAMFVLRKVLDLPDATIPELVVRIAELKRDAEHK